MSILQETRPNIKRLQSSYYIYKCDIINIPTNT